MSRAWFLLAPAAAVTMLAVAVGTLAEVRGAPAPSLEATAAHAPAQPPLLGLRSERSEPRGLEPAETTATHAPAGPPPVELLRAWDARRAQAWARGDPRLLRALYTPGSVAGRHDRAMLRAWVARGLVVRQLRTQLLSVRELAHGGPAWTLLVTDRLAGGVAVGAGVRRRLPQDRATTRTVTLRRVHGDWRVASVRTGEVRP